MFRVLILCCGLAAGCWNAHPAILSRLGELVVRLVRPGRPWRRRNQRGTKMWKFAIDIGPPTKWTGVPLKRPDKDVFEAAPPKAKLSHSVAVTNCRLDFRTPLDSLAKGSHLLAGKLVVIFNSQPTRTNQKSALDRRLAAWFEQISKPARIWKEKRSQMCQLTSGPKK